MSDDEARREWRFRCLELALKAPGNIVPTDPFQRAERFLDFVWPSATDPGQPAPAAPGDTPEQTAGEDAQSKDGPASGAQAASRKASGSATDKPTTRTTSRAKGQRKRSS